MTSKTQDVIDGISFENPENRELGTTSCSKCGLTMFLWRHEENWCHRDVIWHGRTDCSEILKAHPVPPTTECRIIELPNGTLVTAVTPDLLRGGRMRFSRTGATWLYGPDDVVIRVTAAMPGWRMTDD